MFHSHGAQEVYRQEINQGDLRKAEDTPREVSSTIF
jgi:hypothetical protein